MKNVFIIALICTTLAANAQNNLDKKGYLEIGFSTLLLQPSEGDLKPFVGISLNGGGFVSPNSYFGAEIGICGLVSEDKVVGTFTYTYKGDSKTYTDGKITLGYNAIPILGMWAYAPDVARKVSLNIGPILGTTIFQTVYRFTPTVENKPKMERQSKAAFCFGGEFAILFKTVSNASFGVIYRLLGNTETVINPVSAFGGDHFGGIKHQIKLAINVTF